MTEPLPGAADTALPVSTSAVDERPISLRAYPCRSRPAATANATTMTRTQWAAGVHLARRCRSASFSVGLLMWGCSCGTGGRAALDVVRGAVAVVRGRMG